MKNKVILAVAGSGKTTELVDLALASQDKKILLTTYTLENVAQIEESIVARMGHVPSHITVMSWFSLLIRDGVRPYQRDLFPDAPRVTGLFFEKVPDSIGRPTKAQARYYLTKDHRIYRDRTSDFVVAADAASKGEVIKRVERIYDSLFIDEIQDMSGYDLDFLELLFSSSMRVTCAGDVRQATYFTNDNQRHKQYRGAGLVKWFEIQKKRGMVEIEERAVSHRSNSAICAFANALFPDMGSATACVCAGCREHAAVHSGVHFVPREQAVAYVATHSPRVLRYSASANTLELPATNFGECKGRTYDHVLIFPTARIEKYLKTWNPADVGDKERFYVAVTRARHSVGIVVKKVPTLPSALAEHM